MSEHLLLEAPISLRFLFLSKQSWGVFPWDCFSRFAECSICLFRISVNNILANFKFPALTPLISGIFDDAFIDYLFDLVEQTRYMHDDTFNYSVIKLIVRADRLGPSYKFLTRGLQIALNEQFMVTGLGDEPQTSPEKKNKEPPEPKNRIIRVMMRRLGTCRTFGENMIFMLNRASESNLGIFWLHLIFFSPQNEVMTIFAWNF